jgi:hypothetical protein
MSQASASSGQSQVASLSRELNEDVDGFEAEAASVEEVVDAYTDLPPEDQRGRPVLSDQVPPVIGEELLTSLPLTPLYRYSRGSETTTAYRIGETTKALIRFEDEERSMGARYMLPPLGEAQLDLRWMLLQSRFREIPFTVEYLTEDTVRSILKTTRPEHRAGIEQLLAEHEQ